MKKFDIENKPRTELYRKKTTVELAFINEPFEVDTQEGEMVISPETVDDWDNGYYIAYPDDGSKPSFGYGARIVKTGQSACLTTLSATEPNTNRCQPDSPWVAITMMSAFSCAANVTISCAGLPRITNVRALISAGSFSRRISSREFFADPSNSSRTAGI